ncbi:MAG TPA: FAD-dependent oxidoreductase, partial [Balneolaceae bacterium]
RNLAADDEETDHFGTNETIKKHLVKFVSEVLKLPDGWQVQQEWSGIMGFTQTKTPVVRQLDKHCFVAAGLSGMGVAIGTGIGRDAAEMLGD